jgi:drug/metabolite transporter (DMT)-like permease
VDKVLLRKPQTRDLAAFVFWLGFISVLGLCLIPFGFKFPGWGVAWLAFGAGVIHLAANYLYYAALKKGEASETLAMMGGFSPVFTAVIGIPLLDQLLGKGNLMGFVLMVAGGFVMFFSERFALRRVLFWVISASATFGLTNVLQKVVFNDTNFVSGYVFFTMGTFAGSLLLLLRPLWRRQIFKHSEEAPPKSKVWYMVNRFMAGVGSFLVFYAISLASPALVDAITGVRYVLIFFGAFVLTKFRPTLLRENFTGWTLAGKTVATALVIAGLVLLGISGANTSQSALLKTRAAPLLTPQSPLPPSVAN